MSKIPLFLVVILFGGLFSWIALWARRARARRQLALSSITPEALYGLLNSERKINLFDVRQPLDLLTHSEIIPGARRIPPKEVLANPSLIPRDEDSVVYCTCPSDETSRSISEKARVQRHFRVKFLKGGLGAWKAKGYPVERYEEPFRLDTGS